MSDRISSVGVVAVSGSIGTCLLAIVLFSLGKNMKEQREEFQRRFDQAVGERDDFKRRFEQVTGEAVMLRRELEQKPEWMDVRFMGDTSMEGNVGKAYQFTINTKTSHWAWPLLRFVQPEHKNLQIRELIQGKSDSGNTVIQLRLFPKEFH